MKTCYYCETEISEKNKSKEHIIHEFLGGNTTSTQILCRECNSKLGGTIDLDFYHQLKPLTNLIVSKNQKKNFREKLVDKDGNEYFVKQKLEPLSRIYLNDINNNITKTIHVSKEELEKNMEDKRSNASDKFIVSEIYQEEPPLQKLYFTNSLSSEIGKFGLGGPSYHKAILKIAINYYLSLGYEKQYIQEAIKVLKGESGNTRLSIFYYPRHYQIHKIEDGEVSNILYLVGDPKQKTLFCYIELLSSERLIVKLNMEYDGPTIKEQYIFDVVTQTYLNKELNIKLLRHHIEILHLVKNTDLHEELHNRLIHIIQSKQDNINE